MKSHDASTNPHTQNIHPQIPHPPIFIPKTPKIFIPKSLIRQSSFPKPSLSKPSCFNSIFYSTSKTRFPSSPMPKSIHSSISLNYPPFLSVIRNMNPINYLQCHNGFEIQLACPSCGSIRK